MAVGARPVDVVEGDDVRVSLWRPGQPDARLINVYRLASRKPDAPQPRKRTSGKLTSPPAQGPSPSAAPGSADALGKSSNTKAERLFKNAVRQLNRGNRDAALALFDRAKAADPSEAMTARISAALTAEPQESSGPDQGAATKKQ